jgi:hypothetical protein
MSDQELKVIDAMERFGGSFVKALANCFRHADCHNFLKLKGTFWEYWNQYEKMANKK